MSNLPERNVYDDADSVAIMQERLETKRNLGTITLARAAKADGASITWFSRRDLWATLSDRRIVMAGHVGPESVVGAAIVLDKQFTKELLAAAGVSVPAGREVTSAEDAVQFQQSIHSPVVVKPIDGIMGRGVTVNVTDPDDVRSGFHHANQDGHRVMVEQYIDGTAEYRAHATPTECVSVFRRLLPSVTGDGTSTVRELIQNANKVRRMNPSTRVGRIPMDTVAEGFLRRQGLDWDSILPAGQNIIVRNVNGVTSGGDSEECLDSVSAAVKQTAVQTAAAIPGLDWTGVDILVEEKTGKPYVLEANTNASINGATFPSFGAPRDLNRVLWRCMYERSIPETTGTPGLPQACLSPQPLLHGHEDQEAVGGSETITLRYLLERWLQSQHAQVNQHTQEVWSADYPSGQTLWFSSLLSIRDLQTATRQLRRPLYLRRILRKGGVLVPAGRRVRTMEQLEDFRQAVGVSVTLQPYSRNVDADESIRVGLDTPIDEALFNGTGSWLAQARTPGPRFSVIATAESAMAVIIPPGQMKPKAETLERVAALAVSAIRAVPQLRWATVSIAPHGPGHDPDMVVENLAVNPVWNAKSQIVAGSLQSVYKVLTS